jgi:hypothetical protein
MVHARFPAAGTFELWLGESKLYVDPTDAVSEAIASIRDHIEKGFLTNQKLILGPQIPKNTPHYDEIVQLFKTQTSLDKLVSSAVFVVGIFCDSAAAKAAASCSQEYVKGAIEELSYLAGRLNKSGLCTKLRLLLVYVPLASKDALVSEFDKWLKGLQ